MIKKILSLSFILFFIGSLSAQFVQLGNQIDGGPPNDQLGFSIDMNADGTRFVVGAPTFGDDHGVVRVYEKNGSQWIQLGNSIEGTSVGDGYGFSVSINDVGDRVALGGLGSGPNIEGQTRIYELNGSSWQLLGNAITGDSSGDQMGSDVDLNGLGNRVIVGARNNGANGIDAGQVKVFEFQGSSWSQLGGDFEGDVVGEKLGSVVSMNESGDIIALGAPQFSSAADFSGKVITYQWQGSEWNQVGDTFLGSGPFPELGSDVSLSNSGLRVAISSPLDLLANGTGRVQVFDYTGSSWSQVGDDLTGTSSTEAFGLKCSISGDGNRIALGTEFADDVALSSGRVNIYELIGSSWSEITPAITGASQFETLGSSISLNDMGNGFAVGAKLANSTMGYARVYEDMNQPVSIEAIQQLGLSISIVNNVISITQGHSKEIDKVSIYNLTGQLIYEAIVNDTSFIQVGHELTRGVYLIQVVSKEIEETIKVMIP